MKSSVFRPALDGLESRLVLSALAARRPAQVSLMGGIVSPNHPRPSLEAARFEVRWMREMVSHHGMAIRMARVALQNSTNSEVLSLARGIIRAQTREIGQLQSWLSVGYSVHGVRPRMTPDDMEMLAELGSLRGAEFDRVFLTEMVEHHRAAVEDANELLDRAFHTLLRRLGRNIIATQTAEIGRMQALLAQ